MLSELHLIFFLVGLGTLAIAYGLRRSSLGILAILLIGLGYWSGWNQIYLTRNLSGLDAIALQMPIVAAILFLPLAYWCRSKVLFGLSAIAVCSALLSSLAEVATKASVLPSLLLMLPVALLWSYDDTILGQREKLFQPIARRLAVRYLGGLFYGFSFYWIWGNHAWYTRILEWRSLPSVAILAAIAIGQWVFISIRTRDWNTVMIGSMIGVSTIVNFWHLRVQPIPVFAAIVFNLMLALLSIVTLRNSLQTKERQAFWSGVTLLVLQVLSRSPEYELNLPLVFMLCGIATIGAGLWFERQIRALPINQDFKLVLTQRNRRIHQRS
ncbi:MAG: hypothetical protein C4288_05555 [Leptolyngbya sp. ERB_1_1]